MLKRITDEDGNKSCPLSETQKTKHRKSVGSAITATSFICQQYVLAGGKPNYVQTSFCCLDCKMPLCLTDWHSNERVLTCFSELKSSNDPTIECNNTSKKGKRFQQNKRVIM